MEIVSQIDVANGLVVGRSRLRRALASRAMEYGLLLALGMTAFYAAWYAFGTHLDVQHSLLCIDRALESL